MSVNDYNLVPVKFLRSPRFTLYTMERGVSLAMIQNLLLCHCEERERRSNPLTFLILYRRIFINVLERSGKI
jgi:hypothetical protein